VNHFWNLLDFPAIISATPPANGPALIKGARPAIRIPREAFPTSIDSCYNFFWPKLSPLMSQFPTTEEAEDYDSQGNRVKECVTNR
jgi:hypothetical protein